MASSPMPSTAGWASGFQITPKPTRHKEHKLKAYDQRLFQKIPEGHKTQKLGFNGYFKIQVTGAELLATYISAKCKDETAGGCGAGYNLTHGETYANESITVDLTTGDLTQEWVYMNTGILTVPESNKQQVLEATPLPWPQNASHQGVFWNSEHTSMD
ncbi:unnamed protein product [Effrenium voratum]|nr:unnamed protein product [Effrenium voratum]